MTSSRVELHSDGILINGEPLILLSSSLFYFRIPAFEWRSRMRSLRRLGYNAIDVYFPWNYHELAPDQWDFSGERDVRDFLQQASDEGLWVIARPGPYICSEWDGGALPAYLCTIPGLRLRDNNPEFLQAVKKWFDRILPILVEFQVERGGPIVLVQLDNELDFYDCTDRTGYMTALRDMALQQGITVPLIACSGQGDIPGATGNVEGVAPACNVYFDPRDPQLEPRVRHYSKTLRAQGLPLCVIETNRSHTDLRRLLAGGAKLLGPYLQTGGTDFGFTTSVTNWGDPLSFMTSHYDFGGMISPAGKVRPEGREALIISKMIRALGPALALSEAVDTPPLLVQGVDAAVLALKDGGWLIGLPNPGEKPVEVCVGEAVSQFSVKTKLIVDPNTCPFVLADYPLTRWGVPGQIAYSTAELVDWAGSDNTLELTFAVAGEAEIVLRWDGSALGNHQGWKLEAVPAGWRLWLESAISARAELTGQDGKKLVLKALSREEVTSLEKAGVEAWQVDSAQPESDIHAIWRMIPVDPCAAEWFESAKPCFPNHLHLEQNSICRGFGWYRATFPTAKDLKGFLVHSGGDILSIYLDDHYLGTLAPNGGEAFLPLSEGITLSKFSQLVIRTEIWGHANFDDHRLPSLRLKALRGLGGVTSIQEHENLTPNWFYQDRAQAPAVDIDPSWPMLYFGGWSTTDEPAQGVYYRDLTPSSSFDIQILHFPGLQVNARVFIAGQLVGVVNPFNPFIDVSSRLRGRKTARLAIVLGQPFRRPSGEVVLYQGNAIQGWELVGWGEAELSALAGSPVPQIESVKFPLTLPRGEMAWLHADLPLEIDWEQGWGLQLAGQGIKLSAWVGSRLVGRIWLPSEMRPLMTGGAYDRLVLPSAWLREAGGKVHLLLESVSNQPFGELNEIRFIRDI